MTPEEARAREEIRNLQAVYHFSGDRGRIDELIATFAEEGVLETPGGTYRGREAIREALSGVRPAPAPVQEGRPFLHHHLTTARIEFVAPDEAEGWSYFLVMSPVGVDHSGRYLDRYVRVGDDWLIAHRRAVVFWASPDSLVGARAR